MSTTPSQTPLRRLPGMGPPSDPTPLEWSGSATLDAAELRGSGSRFRCRRTIALHILLLILSENPIGMETPSSHPTAPRPETQRRPTPAPRYSLPPHISISDLRKSRPAVGAYRKAAFFCFSSERHIDGRAKKDCCNPPPLPHPQPLNPTASETR